MRYFFTLLFLSLLCTCARAQRMLPTAEIGVMAEEIYQTIVDKHPVAFRPEGVAALQAARTQVLAEVAEAMTGRDSITYHEFAKLMSPLQEATQCGHLRLIPYLDSLTNLSILENDFPLSLMPLDGGTQYVLLRGIRTTADSLLPGTPIRAINGISTSTLLDQVSRFIGLNDAGNDHAAKVGAAKYFSILFQRYYDQQDSLVLDAVNNGLVERHVLLPKFERYYADTTARDINDILQFELLEEGTIGRLTIASFDDFKFTEGNFYYYVRGVMDSLIKGDVPNLIIDLRSNTGGTFHKVNYLFRFLADKKFQICQRAALTGLTQASATESPKVRKLRARGAVTSEEITIQKYLTKRRKPFKGKWHYSGKVVVLVDELSFSASGLFSRMVQGSGRGILVGATSGASANVTYGYSGLASGEKNLYGSRNDFRLEVNQVLIELPYATPGNVTPDIPVMRTPQALREGRDEILEAALAYLQQGL